MYLTSPIDTIAYFQVLLYPRVRRHKVQKFINFLNVHLRASFDEIVKVWGDMFGSSLDHNHSRMLAINIFPSTVRIWRFSESHSIFI